MSNGVVKGGERVENLETFIPIIVPVLPMVIITLKLGIDSFHLMAVEKVFMVPSKRLLIFFSQIIITSCLMFIVFYTLDAIFYNYSEIDLIDLAVIVIIGTTSIFMLVLGLNNNLSVRFSFSFQEPNLDEWEIEKRVSKNRVLASKNGEFFKHFDINYVMDRELKINIIEKHLYFHKFFVEKYKYIKIVLTLSIGICLVLFYFSVIKTNLFISIILNFTIFIFYSIFVYTNLIKNNENLMKKYSGNQ